MKIFFDSSVLIAALSVYHPEHPLAFGWLDRALGNEVEGQLSTHVLAEIYSVMTGHPSWRVPPKDLLAGLRQFDAMRLVALEPTDYWLALERLANLNLPGGGIYDALHAQAALKADAEVLLTLNPKHFIRLGEDVATLVQTP